MNPSNELAPLVDSNTVGEAAFRLIVLTANPTKIMFVVQRKDQE
jgi:hypothetical protein